MLVALKPWQRMVTDQGLIGRDFIRRDIFLGTQERGPIKTIEEDPDGTDIFITTGRAAKKLPDGSWVETQPITCLVQKSIDLVDSAEGGIVFGIDIGGVGIICPPQSNLDFGRVHRSV